jgi:hypothetical protein
MNWPRALPVFGLLAISLVPFNGAFGQGTPSLNYTAIEATATKPTQIGYYGAAHKDCSPAPLPTLRVIEPPKSGTLTVKRGELTTNKVAGCQGLRTPVLVAYYQARVGVAGLDHIRFEVTNPAGEVNGYDITVTIKDAPKTNGTTDKPI